MSDTLFPSHQRASRQGECVAAAGAEDGGASRPQATDGGYARSLESGTGGNSSRLLTAGQRANAFLNGSFKVTTEEIDETLYRSGLKRRPLPWYRWLFSCPECGGVVPLGLRPLDHGAFCTHCGVLFSDAAELQAAMMRRNSIRNAASSQAKFRFGQGGK
jgi:hypothetical protein